MTTHASIAAATASAPDGWTVAPGPRLLRVEAGLAVQSGPAWCSDTDETRAEAHREAAARNAGAAP